MLHAAFDALVGPGRWQPRTSLGAFPLRFPHDEEPDDAGWHIDGSYQPPGRSGVWVNVNSKDRALLMLFLFTDVGETDAPTRIRVGSHLDVPKVPRPLRRARHLHDGGGLAAGGGLGPSTGRAGDVFLCHPFLVHAAQPHHGEHPRFMAQPPLPPAAGLMTDADASPVATTIRAALQH